MRRVSAFFLTFMFLGSAWAATTKKSSPPGSPFRKYFWGARQAYEDRDFKKAGQLLRTYHDLGSPSDQLLKLAGCDPTWEVSVLTRALKDTRACLAQHAKILFWTDPDQAKLAVLKALRENDAAALEPYVDCAPMDLVMQSTTCGTHHYRQAADLQRLSRALAQLPDIMKRPNWREFPPRANDQLQVRWVLYTYSEQWKPCDLAGSALLSLRQDPVSGEIRIAGFAASCLDALP